MTEVPVEKNEDVPATEALAGLMPAPPTRFYPASADTSRPASSWEISIPGTPSTPVSSLEAPECKGVDVKPKFPAMPPSWGALELPGFKEPLRPPPGPLVQGNR